MSCNNSLCLDQLLEPDPDDVLMVVNNNGSPAFFETGIFPIPSGATGAEIVFTVQKASANYVFVELSVENLVDPSPLSIVPTVTGRAKTAFSVGFNAMTDSANYQLRYTVEVIEL